MNYFYHYDNLKSNSTGFITNYNSLSQIINDNSDKAFKKRNVDLK